MLVHIHLDRNHMNEPYTIAKNITHALVDRIDFTPLSKFSCEKHPSAIFIPVFWGNDGVTMTCLRCVSERFKVLEQENDELIKNKHALEKIKEINNTVSVKIEKLSRKIETRETWCTHEPKYFEPDVYDCWINLKHAMRVFADEVEEHPDITGYAKIHDKILDIYIDFPDVGRDVNKTIDWCLMMVKEIDGSHERILYLARLGERLEKIAVR